MTPTRLAFLLLLFLLAACSDGDRCYDSTHTAMVTSLVVDETKTINDLFIKGLNRNDVGDTLVYDESSALTKRGGLPLALGADSTGLVIRINGHVDTLFIRHTMTIKLISENCGFAPYYQLNGFRYTRGIDSVKVTDRNVDPKSIEKSANDQNIKLYFNAALH